MKLIFQFVSYFPWCALQFYATIISLMHALAILILKPAGCNYKQILVVGGALCLFLLAILGIASYLLVMESKF